MKSAISRLTAKGAPVPIAKSNRGMMGHSFNLGAGKADRETMMRQYGMSGTLFSIVSLLAQSAAASTWHLYKKAPVDGRRRYSTSDAGSDQRIEVVSHAAINVWDRPNGLYTGFEFREASQQHQELTGETFWVADLESGFPTSLWCVRPDRMEPVSDRDGNLVGWYYTGPDGSTTPLDANQVILEKLPDPLDPYRGAGPVASIMPNIQQQRYATEYQRNLFFNGADPGGVITVQNNLNDEEYDNLVNRWRESHRGVARAGHVGVLEAGMIWTPNAHSNKDLEYGQLRLANRDELREAWRIHKAMLGTADDVNRANAQTAEEVFVAWEVIPRLNRRRDTLNNKFLPLFGSAAAGVEFDYEDPSPVNAENAANELLIKSQAAVALVGAGFDPSDVLEVVGLPEMSLGGSSQVAQAALESQDVSSSGDYSPPEGPQARERVIISNNSGTKVFKQLSKDFPPSAIAWTHDATWIGPVDVPLAHIDWTPDKMEGSDPDHVQEFVEQVQDGKKLKPVILVKIPGSHLLQLIDGHHRYLADAQMKLPVRAFIGTVTADHGPWESMHEAQFSGPSAGPVKAKRKIDLSSLVRLTPVNGHEPINGNASRKVNHG